ncbi:UDP-N-acetylmuramoyl-L-alanyl-D-glutamate--2,6-diaminopimelate ligase [Paenibacillus aurantius]|uniref:UDP-N-acetylmuramoyl-L-alanyl-D-glutamate--2, 6-diaminopimelate ligase n=1 Tax=Paenibacillus aurantius TaxID=2918900 RepID=UPI00387FA887
MELKELAQQLPTARISGDTAIEISGLSINTRTLQPGELFICIPGVEGLQEDRHSFIKDALKAEAAALVVEREIEAEVPVIRVEDARYALAVLSAHFFDYPSSNLKLIGVTGTNGKTTTTYLIDAILSHAGYRTGRMGNIGTKIGSTFYETDINTQDPIRLQSNLRRMKEISADFCTMEVSSQGLDLGRVLGCEFRTAVFTNLTQDHLDYHGSMEEYLAAKGLLFSRLGNSFSKDQSKRKFAVLNADEEASSYLRKVTPAQVITYGIDNAADVRAKDIQLTSRGTRFTVESYAGQGTVDMNLIGKFNVYNALAAISTALAEQIPLETCAEGLSLLQNVPGRMEVVEEGQDYLVIADYAHTPDGVEKTLSALREFAGRRILTVFGCGGDRDRAKRPIMGRIAAKYSDYVILTSDNPRKEDPDQIIQDMEPGLYENQAVICPYEKQPDRRQAIRRAIFMAEPGDIVLIAGKGHEPYQILHDRTIPFDDREEAKEVICSRMKEESS